MKKLIFLLLCFATFSASAQKKTAKNSPTKSNSEKYTLEQAEKSEDPKVLANFIVNHPNHPKTQALKQRLAYLMTHNAHINAQNKKQNKKTEIAAIIPAAPTKSEHQQNEDILNHILNGNTKSTKAYILIKNASQCDIVVHLKGSHHYQVNIPAGKNGRLLVDKGKYHISSRICNANYNSDRQISHDFEMTLNNK